MFFYIKLYERICKNIPTKFPHIIFHSFFGNISYTKFYATFWKYIPKTFFKTIFGNIFQNDFLNWFSKMIFKMNFQNIKVQICQKNLGKQMSLSVRHFSFPFFELPSPPLISNVCLYHIITVILNINRFTLAI